MISMTFMGVKFGADKLDDGIQLNFLDDRSGIVVHVPFGNDNLPTLIQMVAPYLSDNQKRELASLFSTSGIVIPEMQTPPLEGPQG